MIHPYTCIVVGGILVGGCRSISWGGVVWYVFGVLGCFWAFLRVLENLTLYGVVVGVIGWMSICVVSVFWSSCGVCMFVVGNCWLCMHINDVSAGSVYW